MIHQALVKLLTNLHQLPNCEGVALGCANPPDPIPAPLSTYTYTQPAQRTGEPPPCYHSRQTYLIIFRIASLANVEKIIAVLGNYTAAKS